MQDLPQDPATPDEGTPVTPPDGVHDRFADLAPDANDPGDNELPEELKDLVHEGDIVPDNVDKEEVE